MKMKFPASIILVLFITACHKEPAQLRTASYTLIDQRNTGLHGSVTINERLDSPMLTEIYLSVKNTVSNGIYVAHVHLGPPAHYSYAPYNFGQIHALGTELNFHSTLPMPYDSASVLDGTFVLHESTGDTVLALCGVGKNK